MVATLKGKVVVVGGNLHIHDYSVQDEVKPGYGAWKQGNVFNVKFLDSIIKGKDVYVTGNFQPTYSFKHGLTDAEMVVTLSPENLHHLRCYKNELERVMTMATNMYNAARTTIQV